MIQDPYVRRDDPSVWRDQYGTEYVGRHERVHPEPCHDNACPNWRTYYEALKRGDQQTMTTMEKSTEREIFKTSGLSKGDYQFIGNLIGFFVFWLLIWLVAYEGVPKVFKAMYEATSWKSKYDFVGHFYEGLARVELGDKYGFVNERGNVVIPLKYDEVESFSGGLAGVKLGDKYGFIDKQDNIVIPLKYDKVERFSGGLAAVEHSGKWGFIDKHDNIVMPLKYDSVRSFSGGLAEVELNGKLGFIDQRGNEVAKPKYDKVGFFSEGLAAVRLNGKEGFVDKEGNEVVPVKYNSAGHFRDGLAQVWLNGNRGFVDKKGNEYWNMSLPEAIEQMNKW
jgi:hypothetical protein